MPIPPQNPRDFKSLVKVVEMLRGPDGCPWDKEQTHQSLTPYAIEEVYELVDAIESQDMSAAREELGDVLLQVVLHAEVARQSQLFAIEDVVESITTKMIRRHPHVFAEVSVKDSAEVMKNWAEIKAKELSDKPKDVFDHPKQLPALMVANKIGSRTRKLKFDWENSGEVFAKVEEEFEELRVAIRANDKTKQMAEMGDVLFSLAQLARHLDFDPEQALRQTNQRFKNRFQKMNDLCRADGLTWEALTNEQKEQYWGMAKKFYP